MFLLNLSFAEFLAIFGSLSGLLVALYLLDRSRRRQKVATLRFWISAQRPTEVKHRKRIQQPWSLILQLLSVALLLLALAQLQLGSRDRTSRDHILVLDTSAWMNARTAEGTLMDKARSLARAWLRSVPSADRVMLVRGDALATPATAFETNRQVLEDAIRESRPGSSALNLEQALRFAGRVRKLHTRRPGEIVVVGSGRIPSGESAAPASLPDAVRYLTVPSDVENVGLRKIGLRRSAVDPGLWDVFVSARNYGRKPQTVPLALQFGGAPAGAQKLAIAPGADANATFSYRTKAAGWLEVRLLANDAFPQDDRALLELPPQKSLRVAVYSAQPDLLRPLFASVRVQAAFYSPFQYQPRPDADVMILDGFAPPAPPQVEAIWIDPPSGASPAGVIATRTGAQIRRWRTETELGAGLRVKDVTLPAVQVFTAGPDDIPVAEVDGGPVILARNVKPRLVVLGFHPMRSDLRYKLAAPLLFANIFRWLSPETFRTWEMNAGSVGTVAVPIARGVPPDRINVTADGRRIPFTVQDQVLRFFAGTPSTVRVQTGDREVVYSLTLPEVADAAWTPPASVRRGIPRYASSGSASDTWPWLAVLGGLGLLAEWLIYGRRISVMPAAHRIRPRLPWRAGRPQRRAS